MKFLYTATDTTGKKIRAEIIAASRQGAISNLKSRKLVVTSLIRLERSRKFYIGGVTTSQKIVFTKHLAVMLKAGVGLAEALDTLSSQSKGKMSEILHFVMKDVDQGMKLSDAFSKHQNVFNQYYISMVKTGEESGNLAEDLEQLSTKYAKDHDLVVKVKSALLYPAIVLALTVALGMSISIFILPKLIPLFKSLKYNLPWYTKAMISISAFLSDYGIAAVIGLIVIVVLFIYLIRRPFMARYIHPIYLRLPILGEIIHTFNMARFSMILGSLLKSGIPISPALTTTANMLGNVVYRKALLDAVPRVKSGEPFSSVIEESPLFPQFATKILVIGEQTGSLTDMLLYLSDYYEHELDTTLKNLSTILEPALIIFIGLIVLAVALSIITPIYNFVGVVS